MRSEGSPLGSAGQWSRDLAIVGGGTSFLAIFFVERGMGGGLGATFMFAATGFGALIGALFGLALRRLLLAWLRLPIVAWMPISLLLGGLWGSAVGALAMLVAEGGRAQLSLTALSAVVAGIAGALQLGWFWLPYAVRSGRGKSTWPVVVAALLLGSLSGHAALRVLFLFFHPQWD
jgi:hypothetical protein